nr:hypothetical protein [Thermosipho melanesiensis]
MFIFCIWEYIKNVEKGIKNQEVIKTEKKNEKIGLVLKEVYFSRKLLKIGTPMYGGIIQPMIKKGK